MSQKKLKQMQKQMTDDFHQELQSQMLSFTESMNARLGSMIPAQPRMQGTWQRQMEDLKNEMDKKFEMQQVLLERRLVSLERTLSDAALRSFPFSTGNSSTLNNEFQRLAVSSNSTFMHLTQPQICTGYTFTHTTNGPPASIMTFAPHTTANDPIVGSLSGMDGGSNCVRSHTPSYAVVTSISTTNPSPNQTISIGSMLDATSNKNVYDNQVNYNSSITSVPFAAGNSHNVQPPASISSEEIRHCQLTSYQARPQIETSNQHVTTPIRLRAFNQHDIATYDGKNPWSDYECLVEHTAHFYGWSMEEKVMAVIANLRDDALRLFATMPTDNLPSWHSLRQLMRDRFTVHEQVCFQEFKRRVQGTKESLAEFATALELLSISAFRTTPKAYVDDLLKNQFIDGLRDIELMKLVAAGQPVSIKTALAAAQDIQARSDRHRVKPIYTVDPMCTNNNKRSARMKNFSQNKSVSAENSPLSALGSEGRADIIN